MRHVAARVIVMCHIKKIAPFRQTPRKTEKCVPFVHAVPGAVSPQPMGTASTKPVGVRRSWAPPSASAPAASSVPSASLACAMVEAAARASLSSFGVLSDLIAIIQEYASSFSCILAALSTLSPLFPPPLPSTWAAPSPSPPPPSPPLPRSAHPPRTQSPGFLRVRYYLRKPRRSPQPSNRLRCRRV